MHSGGVKDFRRNCGIMVCVDFTLLRVRVEKTRALIRAESGAEGLAAAGGGEDTREHGAEDPGDAVHRHSADDLERRKLVVDTV